MKIETNTYDFIGENYENAISWMREIGVKISSGRTQNYLKVMNHWRRNYKSSSDKIAKDIFPDFVNSTSEIDSFIKIYKAFKNVPTENLSLIKAKLQKGVNGPLNAEDEKPKTSEARNFIFEALVAAKFHNPKQNLSTILSTSSDTAIKFENKNIFIECKRVTSEKNLENNIRKASNQLDQHLSKKVGKKLNLGNKGLVALDFSKILHSGDQLLVKPNDAELLDSVEKITKSFINKYTGLWNKIYETKNKRIIGTLVYFSTMATSEERNLLVNVSDWGVNPKISTSTYNNNLLKRIATILNNIET
ncbi:hypothetical protein MNBD_BACTEROID01-136 [hydrothermal vent metagenome]|uniref:Uncharacterized protein n=1 Tax=hydrothermal vent metagenome TaxID=652676 RepID=A0A3B0TL00_9ZZZZ